METTVKLLVIVLIFMLLSGCVKQPITRCDNVVFAQHNCDSREYVHNTTERPRTGMGFSMNGMTPGIGLRLGDSSVGVNIMNFDGSPAGGLSIMP